MSSLVDATFRTLACRFQRGGTLVETTHRPEPGCYHWIFVVRGDSQPKGVSVSVEVGLLAKNVYKIGDTVQITVLDLVGPVPAQRFEPVSGNSPSLERIESFVRSALAGKLANSPPLPVVVFPEMCSIQSAEPLPDPVPLPIRRRERSRRKFRNESAAIQL